MLIIQYFVAHIKNISNTIKFHQKYYFKPEAEINSKPMIENWSFIRSLDLEVLRIEYE